MIIALYECKKMMYNGKSYTMKGYGRYVLFEMR